MSDIDNKGTVVTPLREREVVQGSLNLPNMMLDEFTGSLQASEVPISYSRIGAGFGSQVQLQPNKNSQPVDLNIDPQDNVLHEYASVTYNFTLSMLTIEQLNNILARDANQSNQPFNYIPKNVLISSGSRYSSDKNITIESQYSKERHPAWREDFYFDEVKITTVISPTTYSRGTNAVEGTMTIVEPNGFTFLNRLITTSNQINPNSQGNYLFTPYMLQMDFYGMHGNSETNVSQQNPIQLNELRKYFPIVFTEIKSKVSNKGTVYTIRFVPYTHRAYSTAFNRSPAEFRIKARTVNDLFADSSFNTTEENIIQSRYQREKTLTQLRLQKQAVNAYSQAQTVTLPTDDIDLAIAALEGSLKNEIFEVSGFCSAYNDWQKEAAKDKQIEYPDSIKIVIDPIIGKSALFSNDDINDITQAAAKELLTNAQILSAQGGKNPSSINWQSGTIVIAAGTIIDKLIEFAVRNSDYFISQIKTNLTSVERQRSVNWYKIIPRIKIGPYDKFRQTYATETIYYVAPYKVYASKHPYLPNGLPRGQAKTYNYIYTGLNKDILDLSIDFNMLYYFSIPVKRNQIDVIDTGDELNPFVTNNNDANGVSSDGVAFYNRTATGGQINYLPTGGNSNKKQLAASALQTINYDSRGDLINVKLKIIGDPDFIKQDDVFYNSFFFRTAEPRIFTLGSLRMDAGELTVRLNIQSPVDYDDETGLAAPGNNQKFVYNLYSGIYKIISVENVFYKGKFEQVLDMVRSPIQSKEQLESLDKDTLRLREKAEKEIENIKNVNFNKPSAFLNVPVRATSSQVSQLARTFAAQQSATNAAAQAAAAANKVIGGLSAVNSIGDQLKQIGTTAITNAATGLLSKGLGAVGQKITDELSILKDSFFNTDVSALGELGDINNTLDAFSSAPIIESVSVEDINALGDLGFESISIDPTNLPGFF